MHSPTAVFCITVIFLFSLSSSFIITLTAASLPCKGEVAIEHFFFDLQKQTTKFIGLDYLEQEGNFRSPVSIKLKCKAAGCPTVNGTNVFLQNIPHHSSELNSDADHHQIPLWVEETSGWLLFYKDEEWKEPLLLTEKTISEKETEQGFVYFETKKGTKNGGVLKFNCA